MDQTQTDHGEMQFPNSNFHPPFLKACIPPVPNFQPPENRASYSKMSLRSSCAVVEHTKSVLPFNGETPCLTY